MQIHLGLYRNDKDLADHQNPFWGRLRGRGIKAISIKAKTSLKIKEDREDVKGNDKKN